MKGLDDVIRFFFFFGTNTNEGRNGLDTNQFQTLKQKLKKQKKTKIKNSRVTHIVG